MQNRSNLLVRAVRKAIRLARAAPTRMFAPRPLSRERRAMIAGIKQYHVDQAAGLHNISLLRRRVHMLEKGLSMRPRRDVFALDYIEETVTAYERRVAAYGGREDASSVWAHDVLNEYFRVTAPHPIIDPLRTRFAGLPSPQRQSAVVQAPFARDLSRACPVSYKDMLALATRRRSVRWFLPDAVPRELIESALAVAMQSPTACNRQPFVFRIFDEPDMVAKVAAIPIGTRGYAHNIPTIAVVVGRQRSFFDPRDRHLIYIDGALATMAFCFALETLGLASCIINWPDIESCERAMADLIGLKPDECPVMLVGLGYPDPTGLVPYSSKKDLSDIAVFG